MGLGSSSHAGTLLTAPEHPPRPPHPRRPWSRARRCPGCPRGFGWRSPCSRTLRTPSFVQTCHPCHFIFPFSMLIWYFHVPIKLTSILCPTRQRGRGVTPVTSTCSLQPLHKPSPRTYTPLRLLQDQALRVSPPCLGWGPCPQHPAQPNRGAGFPALSPHPLHTAPNLLSPPHLQPSPF